MQPRGSTILEEIMGFPATKCQCNLILLMTACVHLWEHVKLRDKPIISCFNGHKIVYANKGLPGPRGNLFLMCPSHEDCIEQLDYNK